MPTTNLALKNDWSDDSPEQLTSGWLNTVADALDELSGDDTTVDETAEHLEGLKRVVRRLLAYLEGVGLGTPPGLEQWLERGLEEYGEPEPDTE